jgi:hypothetical protein
MLRAERDWVFVSATKGIWGNARIEENLFLRAAKIIVFRSFNCVLFVVVQDNFIRKLRNSLRTVEQTTLSPIRLKVPLWYYSLSVSNLDQCPIMMNVCRHHNHGLPLLTLNTASPEPILLNVLASSSHTASE